MKLIGGPCDGQEYKPGDWRTVTFPERDPRGPVFGSMPNGTWYRERVYEQRDGAYHYSHATPWRFAHADWCDPRAEPWRPAPEEGSGT